MKIVIIGLGTIGSDILKMLSNDKHNITVIDDDKNLVEKMIEKHDVQGVVGNGASIDIQMEAGMKHADVAIALTQSDELNIFACLVAKKLGVKHTVARVRNPDYRQQIVAMKDELGISMIVNPEQDTATEIFNLINLPAIVEIERFANGKVLLAEVVVEHDFTLIGETLISIGQKFNTKALICAVQRGENVIIPSGRFVIEENDKICFTANAKELRDFLAEANIVKSPLKNIMIVGGTKIAYYLADQLSQKRYNIKLIEENADIAEELADKLPRVTVVNGSGLRHDILLEEGIESMDAFVAITDDDEDNIITSMFANTMGVKKTITKIQNDDLNKMLIKLGIQNNVSPKDIVADSVTSYVRALSNSKGSNIQALYRLVQGQVEALEFSAKKNDKIYGQPLRELKMKNNCLIASIIRNGRVIVPDGNTSIEMGDNVIVVTTHKNFGDLSDIFE
jgi:trk system potassium uptake protein TrkA